MSDEEKDLDGEEKKEGEGSISDDVLEAFDDDGVSEGEEEEYEDEEDPIVEEFMGGDYDRY